jgi:hypothetical protein
VNRDQQLLALVHHQANAIQTLQALASLTVSKEARQTYRQYGAVTKALRSCLADDQVLVIKTPQIRNWLILAALLIVIAIEFSNYTVPAVHDWLMTVAHKCGL